LSWTVLGTKLEDGVASLKYSWGTKSCYLLIRSSGVDQTIRRDDV